MKHGHALKWLLFPGLALFCGVMFAVFMTRQPTPVAPVMFLPKPYQMPGPGVFMLERWLPATPSWAWLWHLKDAVFGRRSPVDLQVSIIKLAVSSEALVSRLYLQYPADAVTNGERVWLIPNEQLDELQRELKKDPANQFVNAARISTGDQIAASLFSGEAVVVNGFTNSVGLTVEMFPRVHHDSTDLTARMLFSEIVTNSSPIDPSATSPPAITIRTNLDVGARFQIPETYGVFLLDVGHNGGNRTAVILSAKLPGRKK
jgi:hypothetical protein